MLIVVPTSPNVLKFCSTDFFYSFLIISTIAPYNFDITPFLSPSLFSSTFLWFYLCHISDMVYCFLLCLWSLLLFYPPHFYWSVFFLFIGIIFELWDIVFQLWKQQSCWVDPNSFITTFWNVIFTLYVITKLVLLFTCWTFSYKTKYESTFFLYF